MSLNRLRSGGTLANSPATRNAWGVAALMAGTTAAGGASYLLDTYTAYAAYDVAFQLKSDQTQMIEVRESSGGTYAWIGPSGGALDETALLAHTGANNGFIRTLKDAATTASTYDASQSTDANQPRIVLAGVVDTVNGKPAMIENSSSTVLATASIPQQNQPTTVFNVYKGDAATGYVYWGVTATDGLLDLPTLSIIRMAGGDVLDATSITGGNQYLVSSLWNAASSIIRVNGTEKNTGTVLNSWPLWGVLRLGGNSTGNAIASHQCHIFFNDDQSANFAAIESDINSRYGVY